MNTSHIILKVENLHEAVKEYREKGFAVEYGKVKNSFNALIYFSEGPYIEILHKTGMPAVLKNMLRLVGKGKLVERLDYWDHCDNGYCDLGLENYSENLDKERIVLMNYGIESFQKNSRRVDTRGRELRFKIAFPYALDVPFLMTYFTVDPKPQNFVHDNGVKGIRRVIYRTHADKIPLIRELCDDWRLEVLEGSGIQIEFDT